MPLLSWRVTCIYDDATFRFFFTLSRTPKNLRYLPYFKMVFSVKTIWKKPWNLKVSCTICTVFPKYYPNMVRYYQASFVLPDFTLVHTNPYTGSVCENGTGTMFCTWDPTRTSQTQTWPLYNPPERGNQGYFQGPFNARFTTVPFKPFSDQHDFFLFENCSFPLGFPARENSTILS